MKVKVKITNIVYDYDNPKDKDTLNLPTELETIMDVDVMDDIEDLASDYISDTTGFCHWGFNFDVTKIGK